MHDTDEQILNFAALENVLGVVFKEKRHLLTSLTHRSYLNEHPEATQSHNERYEFLGDAVLELAVTDFLFKKYPEKPEGELTAVRAALVNTHSLAQAAAKLDISNYLLLSKGEAKDMGRARQYILANAFEAVIGGIYLDQGYEAAAAFIARQLFEKTEHIVTKKLWQDAKSRLQELAQEHEGITPRYETIAQKGPDHDRTFTVGVFFDSKKVAEGTGRSKQEAEQEAAQAGIEVKKWE